MIRTTALAAATSEHDHSRAGTRGLAALADVATDLMTEAVAAEATTPGVSNDRDGHEYTPADIGGQHAQAGCGLSPR
jgi:hypothetical protein